MSDSPETLRLPPLQQTVLDPATLEALFRDLQACTQVVAVQPKLPGPPRMSAGLPPLSLETARAGLADGSLAGAQIRYRYENGTWCDTLIRRPDGIRLVRICESDIVATLEPTPTQA